MRSLPLATRSAASGSPLPARPSAWALLPGDLRALGAPGDATHLFGRLHRAWTWRGAAPDVGRATREFLEAHVDLALPSIASQHRSADGATKVVVEVGGGDRIEAVHMPRDVRSPRVTLCISSQVGCAMGCTFCATATMGLRRNLDAGEIVGQVLALVHALGPARPQDLTLVFMGMGEPLHNVDHVTRAVQILCHPGGLGVPPGRVTVSTSGLVPGIDKLARAEPRPLLAVSVNATTDGARSRTMPVNRAFDLGALRAALARWPLRHREKITLEYVLLAGENDSPEDATRLAELARGVRHNVNVIPYNAFPESPFAEPTEAALQRFVRQLQDDGCLVTVRRSRGRDVSAACGQLAR